MCTFIGLTTGIATSNIIEAYISDYNLEVYRNMGYEFEYPIISYKDNNYIAIRDVARLWNKDVYWNGQSHSIEFISRSDYDNIIKNEDTALAIGKAIISEYFSKDIKENSAYSVTYAEVTSSYDDDCWRVSVIFDSADNVSDEDILFKADAAVDINASTGNFSITDFRGERSSKVLGFRSW